MDNFISEYGAPTHIYSVNYHIEQIKDFIQIMNNQDIPPKNTNLNHP